METTARSREFEFNLPIGWMDEEGQHQRKVVLRKMTGKEEAILADRKFQKNGGKLVTELIHSCLVRLGDQPKNGRGSVSSLYSADRNYLLLKLRAATFGSDMNATYSCPSCASQIRVTEDLDELPVKTLADGSSPEDVVVELDDGYIDKEGQEHTALMLRLPTGSDEEAVAPKLRKNASLGKNALLARCIKSFGDVPQHRLEALGAHILADLTMTDRRKVDRAINEAAPGVDLAREIECSECGEDFTANLDLSHFLALE